MKPQTITQWEAVRLLPEMTPRSRRFPRLFEAFTFGALLSGDVIAWSMAALQAAGLLQG